MARIVKGLTVIGITPTGSIETGETLHQIAFGKYVKVTDSIVKRIKQSSSDSMLPKEIPINELILIMKFSSLEPYTIGSEWKLEIDDSAKTMKLSKSK